MEHSQGEARERRKPPGPIGLRVARNLKQLREALGLNQDKLATAVKQLGLPMTRSGISKTEDTTRRVDVDDLVAFAVALGVSPNRLLLPADIRDGEPVELLPEVRVSAVDAWRWATGDAPLPNDALSPGFQIRVRDDYERVFSRENRPHEVMKPNAAEALAAAHPELVRMIASVVTEAKNQDLSLGHLLRLVELVDRWRLLGSLDDAITQFARLHESMG